MQAPVKMIGQNDFSMLTRGVSIFCNFREFRDFEKERLVGNCQLKGTDSLDLPAEYSHKLGNIPPTYIVKLNL